MMPFFSDFRTFLSVLGPSVVTTMAGNDGGGVITYSMAGARLGYAALFTLPFLTILYAISQEMGSRIAIVTGKGFGDHIRERYGVRTALVVFLILIVANFGSVLTNVAAIKTSSQMLNVPPIPFIIAAVLVSFVLVTFTKYDKSQKVFLAGMILYFAYVFSAFKSQPNWGESLKSLVIPTSMIFTKEYIVTAIAVLGTTITPWGQFFVQSYMKDKNISIRKLKYAKLESYIGAVVSNSFTYFIILVTAATLFAYKIPLTSGDQAAIAIQPFAGAFAGSLFAIGLVAAGFIGMTIISLSSAYAFTEFFGFAGSLDDPYSRGKIFYSIFLLNLVLSALLVVTPWFPLFNIIIYTQSLNAVLLPVFFYFILKIINNKELMGEHVNGKIYNILAISASIFIVGMSFGAGILTLFPNIL